MEATSEQVTPPATELPQVEAFRSVAGKMDWFLRGSQPQNLPVGIKKPDESAERLKKDATVEEVKEYIRTVLGLRTWFTYGLVKGAVLHEEGSFFGPHSEKMKIAWRQQAEAVEADMYKQGVGLDMDHVGAITHSAVAQPSTAAVPQPPLPDNIVIPQAPQIDTPFEKLSPATQMRWVQRQLEEVEEHGGSVPIENELSLDVENAIREKLVQVLLPAAVMFSEEKWQNVIDQLRDTSRSGFRLELYKNFPNSVRYWYLITAMAQNREGMTLDQVIASLDATYREDIPDAEAWSEKAQEVGVLLYGDQWKRFMELVQEGKVRHPLFHPFWTL